MEEQQAYVPKNPSSKSGDREAPRPHDDRPQDAEGRSELRSTAAHGLLSDRRLQAAISSLLPPLLCLFGVPLALELGKDEKKK
jgi:hypothetical protein